jgi:hypothetical protein
LKIGETKKWKFGRIDSRFVIQVYLLLFGCGQKERSSVTTCTIYNLIYKLQKLYCFASVYLPLYGFARTCMCVFKCVCVFVSRRVCLRDRKREIERVCCYDNTKVWSQIFKTLFLVIFTELWKRIFMTNERHFSGKYLRRWSKKNLGLFLTLKIFSALIKKTWIFAGHSGLDSLSIFIQYYISDLAELPHQIYTCPSHYIAFWKS